MIFYRIIFVVTITLFLFNPVILKSHGCKKLMNIFKESVNVYGQCALTNAVPVKICFNCLHAYDNVTESYDNLLKGNETNSKNMLIHCSDEFLNMDGLNIVEKIFMNAKDLWTKAFCETCFDRNKENIIKSKDVEEFEENSKFFADCESKNKDKDPCGMCSSQYEDLNQRYKMLEDVRNGRICFDIQDEMNRTRSHWSKDLKCCRKEVEFKWFIVVSSVVLALPIFFYLGCLLYSKRVEYRNRASILINDTDSIRGIQEETDIHSKKETVLTRNNSSNDIQDMSNEEEYEDILYKPQRKSSKKSIVDDSGYTAGPSNINCEVNNSDLNFID